MHSPIHNLDNDTLSLVFRISTGSLDIDVRDRFKYACQSSGLQDAVSISHVCNRWRTLTLNSPSLWARLINFESPILRNGLCFLEILRRSARSPLTIRCSLPSDDPRNLFLRLTLDKEWSRVQHLWISFIEKNDAILMLGRPAPLLVSFHISWFLVPPSPHFVQGLFGNNAPNLCHFSCSGIEVPIDDDATWLATLRSLDMGIAHRPWNPPHLGAKAVLNIIKKAHLVEFLQFISIPPEPGTIDREYVPRIPLLHLNALTLTGDYRSCAKITQALDIDANKLRFLAISADAYNSSSLPAPGFETLVAWSFPILERHIASNKSKSMSIQIYRAFSSFDFEYGSSFVLCVAEESNRAAVESVGFQQTMRTTNFFHRLANSNFDSITELTFMVDMLSTESIQRDSFRRIFLSLSRLEVLRTTPECLGDIQQAVASNGGVFPSLRALALEPRDQLSNQSLTMLIMHSFLSWRVAAGNPLRVLKLERSSTFLLSYRDDRRYPELEGFNGLQLQWYDNLDDYDFLEEQQVTG